MKSVSKQVVRVITAAALVSLCRPAVSGADTSTDGPVLQVRVRVAETPRPDAGSQVGERIVGQIGDTFRGMGYAGRVERVDDSEKVNPKIPVLDIDVTHWGRDRVGNFDCRFSAQIEKADSRIPLGDFQGISSRLLHGPGKNGVARSLKDAASQGIHDLYVEAENVGMLRGFPEVARGTAG